MAVVKYFAIIKGKHLVANTQGNAADVRMVARDAKTMNVDHAKDIVNADHAKDIVNVDIVKAIAKMLLRKILRLMRHHQLVCHLM